MAVDPGIFKAYDVRGLYGEQIDADVAYQVGRAFAKVIADFEGAPTSSLTLAVGRDMRLTAPELAARYIDGIRDEGASVVDVGQVGTEMLYFTVGSRDPPAYTGAKLVKRGALALSGDSGIGEIKEMVEAGDPGPPVEPRGELTQEDVSADFQAAVTKFIDPSRVSAGKVVLDGGNGMAGPMVGPILDTLDIEQVQTYWTPDGKIGRAHV